MLPFAHRLRQFGISAMTFFAGAITMALLGLFIVPVLAQEATEVVAGSGSGGLGTQITTWAVGIFLAASAIIGRYVVKYINRGMDALDKWIANKIENEFVEGAFLRLAGLGRTVVLNTWSTSYKATKTSLRKALGDGKIEKSELIQAGNSAKQTALTQLRAITPKTVLRSILGKKADTDPGVVDDLLGAVIEGAVHDAKLESKAANAVAGASGGK